MEMEEPTSNSTAVPPPLPEPQPQPPTTTTSIPTPNMDEANSNSTPQPPIPAPAPAATQPPIPNVEEPKSNPTTTIATAIQLPPQTQPSFPAPQPPVTTQLQPPNMDQPNSNPIPVSLPMPTPPPTTTTQLPPLAPSSKHQSDNNNNNSKKRKMSDAESNYFRVCAIVSHLRPHFIEVLRTPDFRNSRAAHEIQRQMKLVVDTYKLIVPENEPILNDLVEGKSNDPLSGPNGIEMKSKDGETTAGTCIIGGSDLGLNFITYDSGNPVYYGIAKESRGAKRKVHPSEVLEQFWSYFQSICILHSSNIWCLCL